MAHPDKPEATAASAAAAPKAVTLYDRRRRPLVRRAAIEKRFVAVCSDLGRLGFAQSRIRLQRA